MHFRSSQSLQSIEEEESPHTTSNGKVPWENEENSPLFQQNMNQQSLNPFSSFAMLENNDLQDLNNVESPFSSAKLSVQNSNADIERKKSQLLLKYRDSPSKKENLRIFQNKLKQKIKGTRERASTSYFKNDSSHSSFTTKKSKSYISSSDSKIL